MTQFEVIMPKMGESIEEATITKWFVKPGDKIEEDDVLLEIATDKVDSEIPSPVQGIIKKLLYQQDEIVPVGSVIAIIELNDDNSSSEETIKSHEIISVESGEPELKETDLPIIEEPVTSSNEPSRLNLSDSTTGRFYSPLVRKIAEEEKISSQDLESIIGSGRNGRVQKNDILAFLKTRGTTYGTPVESPELKESEDKPSNENLLLKEKQEGTISDTGDEIIKMDRIRKIIAEHMIRSKQISANVTNMVEVDVTNIVNWRNRIKENFEKKEGLKITYLPIFIEAVIQGLKDYPMINSSVDEENIIIKKRINMGIAVALPNYNLIVPVIKNADNLNLTGLTKELNRLANAARDGKLKPEEIQDGTFTITNFGSFKNTIGTPIINQPQVAILATGSIEKKPAVLETSQGDVIAIRHKMFLSLTYDHRIIDGSLGGIFLRKVGDYLEAFDITRTI